MLTNRINVTYNIENIDADFDIFRVEKANKDYYKYNILDSAVYEFKAAAVQWTFGATALVLFRKGEVTEKQFKESIMKEYEGRTAGRPADDSGLRAGGSGSSISSEFCRRRYDLCGGGRINP